MATALNKQDWRLVEEHAADLQVTLEAIRQQRYIPRIWAKDASLWRPEPEHQAEIETRLGWLWLPERCLAQVDHLSSFANQVRRAGFEHVVLLGMGGSSLAAWVFERVFGVTPGYPSLSVLDSTVPQEVLASTGGADPARTLFIAASKSGTTTEVLSFFEYFYDQIKQIRGDAAGENFVAITDPGTPLAQTAHERGLRATFENWPDVGGRYSGLSYFGMLPAALMGLPVREILASAQAMAEACGPAVQPQQNPAACLGALLGCCQSRGRDKVTFLTSPILASFGDWAEQLLAESTGKAGTGLIPVVGEPLGEVGAYSDDRLFVHLHLSGDDRLSSFAAALAAAAHPVIEIEVADVNSLGQEIFRWEFAVAVIGALMGINPFDQPNVQESKDKTREMLAYYSRDGSLTDSGPDLLEDRLAVYGAPEAESTGGAIAALFAQVQPHDYVALMAYLPYSSRTDDALATIRSDIRDRLRVATTTGYGPRFLHSTGQLHKGGPNTAVLLQLTARDSAALPIPAHDYDFATLKDAQASGDFEVLRQRQRRIMRLDLGTDIDYGMAKLAELISEALRQISAGVG